MDSLTEPRTTKPRKTQPRKTQPGMDWTSNGLNLEWTEPQMDPTPNGLNPEWDWTLNGTNPEWDWSPNGTELRIYWTPNGLNLDTFLSTHLKTELLGVESEHRNGTQPWLSSQSLEYGVQCVKVKKIVYIKRMDLKTKNVLYCNNWNGPVWGW